MKKIYLHSFIKIILSILLSFIIIFLSFHIAIFNSPFFYKKQFKQLGVYDKFPTTDVNALHKEVLHYLRYSNDKFIENDFFTEREKSHFKDVKDIFQSVFNFFHIILILFFISLLLLYFFIVKKNKESFLKNILGIVKKSCYINLFIIGIFSVIILFNFSGFFDTFHNLFFESGTWLFDPQFEKIVLMYPESLFLEFGIYIFFILFVSSIIPFTILWLISNSQFYGR